MGTGKQNENNKIQNKSLIGYVLGSVTLLAIAYVIVPKVITKSAGILYKTTIHTNKDDDWGPVIEKKDCVKKTNTEEENEENK